jgi:hypothetical protein
MNNLIDDNLVKEFFEHFKDAPIPNPTYYPKQFQFLIDSFLHYKKMKELNDET